MASLAMLVLSIVSFCLGIVMFAYNIKGLAFPYIVAVTILTPMTLLIKARTCCVIENIQLQTDFIGHMNSGNGTTPSVHKILKIILGLIAIAQTLTSVFGLYILITKNYSLEIIDIGVLRTFVISNCFQVGNAIGKYLYYHTGFWKEYYAVEKHHGSYTCPIFC